jgi:hypothetical protein
MVELNEEDRLIGQVVDRLLRVYSSVPEHTIRAIVESVRGRFDQARIRDFVPLFVERQAKDKLAALTAGAVPA